MRPHVVFGVNAVGLKVVGLSVMATAVGSALYLLWRPTHLVAFAWFDAAGLRPGLDAARRLAAPWKPGDVLLFSAPGGLWAFGFAVALGALYWRDGRMARVVAVSLGPLVGLTRISLHPARDRPVHEVVGSARERELRRMLAGWRDG